MKTQFRLITIIFLAACLLLQAACGSTEAAPTPTPVPTPTPTPVPLTPEEIIDLSTQASRDTPMHMVMDMQMNMKVAEQDVAFREGLDRRRVHPHVNLELPEGERVVAQAVHQDFLNPVPQRFLCLEDAPELELRL